MRNINELSPELVSKAHQAASLRNDPRGASLSKKFKLYADKKAENQPKLKFQINNQIFNGIIIGKPQFQDTLVIFTTRSVGDDETFSIIINMNSKVPFQSYTKNGDIIAGFDRPGAVYLSKLSGGKFKPTDLPLLSSAPQRKPQTNMESIMKEDLTIHEFSLKKIIENFDKIPEKTGKFGEETNSLSKEEKRKLKELMQKFNEYGQALRGDQALMETAKTLSEVAALAKKFAMNEENDDFLQKETRQRDFKQVDGITQQFQKLAKECVSRMMQLNALYEDIGHTLSRYYEIDSINEGIPNFNHPQTNLNTSESGLEEKMM